VGRAVSRRRQTTSKFRMRSQRCRRGDGKLTHCAASSGAASLQRRTDAPAPARRSGGSPRLPPAGGSLGPPTARRSALTERQFAWVALTGLCTHSSGALNILGARNHPLHASATHPGLIAHQVSLFPAKQTCIFTAPCRSPCTMLVGALVEDSLAPSQAPGAAATRPRATTGPHPFWCLSKLSQGSPTLPSPHGFPTVT